MTMGIFKWRDPIPPDPDFSKLKVTLYGNLYRAAAELSIFDDEMTEDEAAQLRSIRDWAGLKYRAAVQPLLDELE